MAEKKLPVKTDLGYRYGSLTIGASPVQLRLPIHRHIDTT